jgi:hypothetical protein
MESDIIDLFFLENDVGTIWGAAQVCFLSRHRATSSAEKEKGGC